MKSHIYPQINCIFSISRLIGRKNVRLAKSWEIWWDLTSHQSHILTVRNVMSSVRNVRSQMRGNFSRWDVWDRHLWPTFPHVKTASQPRFPYLKWEYFGEYPPLFPKNMQRINRRRQKKGGKKPFWKNRFTFLAGTSTILIGWIWKSGDVRKSGEGSDVTCVTRDKLDIICLTVRTLVRKSVRNGEMSIPTNFPHTDRWESAHKEFLTSLSSVR